MKRYVDTLGLAGRRVLEIGLGYGTFDQYLAEQGALYHGIDIAPGTVEMMRHRLGALGGGDVERRAIVELGSRNPVPGQDVRLFGQSADVGIRAEDFEGVAKPVVRVSRERLLRTSPPRLLGLDLYARARE